MNLLTFSYDAAGNTLAAASGAGAYSYTYDALGRVSSWTDPFGLLSTLSYDAAGQRTGLDDGLGGVTSYAYDATGALTQVLFGGAGQTPLREDRSYDARGLLATATRWSDLAGTTQAGDTLYSYDAVGREAHILHRDGSGTALAESSYAYDAAGKLAQEAFNGTATSYGYDGADQVTAAGTETFAYDASGNRDSAGYAVGAGNRVSSDGTWTYSYDAEGQRIKRSKGAGAETWAYGYDERGQMAWAEQRASDGGTLLARWDFAYDALGNRIGTTAFDGTSTVTYHAAFGPDGEAWADLDASNALADRYLRVPGEELPIARVSAAGAAAWLLADRLGSLRGVTDGMGALEDLISYSAFGKILSESDASWGGRFKWKGQEAEAALGQQRHGWRWYDLETGTWTSEDPIGLSGGDYNLTRYVGNDPLGFIDSSGLAQWGAGNFTYPWDSNATWDFGISFLMNTPAQIVGGPAATVVGAVGHENSLSVGHALGLGPTPKHEPTEREIREARLKYEAKRAFLRAQSYPEERGGPQIVHHRSAGYRPDRIILSYSLDKFTVDFKDAKGQPTAPASTRWRARTPALPR